MIHIGTLPASSVRTPSCTCSSPCALRKPVHTPCRSINVLLLYATMPAVIERRLGAQEGPDEIEKRRGRKGGISSIRYSTGGLAEGKSRKTSIAERPSLWQ
eukprot:CAMPEP_0173056558 /NCGR_PEP_ID=MMETSP1102-20130122/208_1 /TAXON_ID=49646 /ORGANISM="Geminigera sp., Strain Caron Lab Isolate" /LENGTH=100 /DNA_ID=CAMNT_0013921889 /DNA_START=697 /DNA_END=999 /DNA_ORIENTATION=-